MGLPLFRILNIRGAGWAGAKHHLGPDLLDRESPFTDQLLCCQSSADTVWLKSVVLDQIASRRQEFQCNILREDGGFVENNVNVRQTEDSQAAASIKSGILNLSLHKLKIL